jgi:hypothetical protein
MTEFYQNDRSDTSGTATLVKDTCALARSYKSGHQCEHFEGKDAG